MSKLPSREIRKFRHYMLAVECCSIEEISHDFVRAQELIAYLKEDGDIRVYAGNVRCTQTLLRENGGDKNARTALQLGMPDWLDDLLRREVA